MINLELSSETCLPAKAYTASDDAHLREILQRCSTTTYIAAREFRKTGGIEYLPAIIHGVIGRHVERVLREKLDHPSGDLRLAEDLGLDSLSMMEIVMLAEDVLGIAIDNDELRRLRTLGDVEHFLVGKLRGLPVPDIGADVPDRSPAPLP